MPVITIQMSEGKTADQKRRVAGEITQTVAETFGVDPAAVIVIFNELPRENIAKSGKLLSD
ncbi:tautomerase family protein [Methanocalculus sp. MC3]